MKGKILIQVVIVSICIVFIFKLSIFFLTTEFTIPSNQIVINKGINDIEYNSYNSLFINEHNYTLVVNKRRSNILNDSLIQTLTLQKKALDKLPLIIIPESQSDYARIVKTLDAVVKLDIKQYEIVHN